MNIKTIDWSAYKGTVPGYGAARAVPGEYAGLFPDRYVESSFSGYTFQNALPGENVNYLRIPHKPGDGRIAGGGQTTDRSLEWQHPHGWVPVGSMFGPNGLVYGYGDFLTICGDRPEYQRTAGWYNGLGALVPSVSARSDSARGIWEYTDFGDVAIGQGANGPGEPGLAAVSFRKTDGSYERLRLLDPRPVGQRDGPFDARFVLTDREGGQFGIAIVNLIGRVTYFCWPTWGELYALPFAA